MTDWSSSRFSRRSTAQTCQPGARATTARASGAKYAALADVPGLRTSTLRALADPIFRMPTRSYLTGVPATLTPATRTKRSAGAAWTTAAADNAPAVARTAARRRTRSMGGHATSARFVAQRGGGVRVGGVPCDALMVVRGVV